MTDRAGVQVSDETPDSLVTVLDLVRSGRARTRPELGQRSGLGRMVVTQRVTQLLGSGLLREGTYAPSTGGRPARELRFRADAGSILVAELGATSVAVGLTDLAGTLMSSHEESCAITAGPEEVLGRLEVLFDRLVASRPGQSPPVWGVGIGLPGPVEYAIGRPISPPIMPGWDGYRVRERFARRYEVPTWIDNEVNLMALGELRLGTSRAEQDMVFIKIGTGIGAGLVSAGRLHRGAQGTAGDLGHVEVPGGSSDVCRCGRTGCLEAIAGGAALGRLATQAARDGVSPILANLFAESDADYLQASDLSKAAEYGDRTAIEIFGRTGRLIGEALAAVVNVYNPSLIVIGGGVTNVGDLLLASIRHAVYSQSLPLATRDLRIRRSRLGGQAGLHGAAFAVIDELFSRQRLPLWISYGSPAHRPQIADTETAA